MNKLSKKGQRLYEYFKQKCLIDGKSSVNIGDICRDCNTTPLTLFQKTYPELTQKGYLDGNGCLVVA